MSDVSWEILAVIVLAFPVTMLGFIVAGPVRFLLFVVLGVAVGIPVKIAMDHQNARIRKLEDRVEQLEVENATESDEPNQSGP